MANKTKARRIMDLACAVAGEDVSPRYGKTTMDAIDALADALAGTDVQEQETIADAVAMLQEGVSSVAGNAGELRAALAAAGVEVEGKSLADLISAATGAVDEGVAPEGGWAEPSDVDDMFSRMFGN